ncbi:MAG TPA: ligase-associated DNA damage response endonuclease PdeM [Roseiarcus sp.]|nr:ligase-associated DNA damage response endonuclease PdeM [Roseiarcus sp.]
MNSFAWNGLTLLPQRAVWREDSRALFVADVHLGKAAAFRAAGLPVPAGTTRENLTRLDELIEALQPRRLIVLGDLFHAPAAYRQTTLREVAAWRARRAGLAVTLVAGNHDARAGAPPATLGLELADAPFALDGLELRHLPLDDDNGDGPPALAGHLHPAARLSGPAHDSLRLPCFVMRGRQLILPAFGEFTGASLATADVATALCVVAGDRLIHIPAAASRRADSLRRSAARG